MKCAAAHSDIGMEWFKWSAWQERGASRGEERVGEGSRRTKWEGILEGVYMAEESFKDFERIGKSEYVRLERITSRVVLRLRGRVFSRGWPGTVAIVR